MMSLKLVYILLTGMSERVADIKTRAHAMKCLTAFAEAVGPGFIFERVLLLTFLIIFMFLSRSYLYAWTAPYAVLLIHYSSFVLVHLFQCSFTRL